MSQPHVFIASDHAGFELKQKIVRYLGELFFEFTDLGPETEDRVDYPDFASKVCESIKDDNQVGILICGSGQGMAMRANKYNHIRAAICWNKESAQLAREHNNANVLCLGARLVEAPIHFKMINTFLNTKFEGGRHQDRVKKIHQST